MRKKLFNYLIWNNLKTFIVIAFFHAFVVPAVVHAASYSSSATVVPTLPVTALTPVWGKLVLSGNTVTCYYGLGLTQPSVWTQIGSPQTINFLNDPILVGMYSASVNTTTLTAGTIDNFAITPAPAYRLADFDVGQAPLMGSANLMGGVWNLSGSGIGMGGSSDQCNLQSWLVWGDCTVIARVTSVLGTDGKSKIGLMIRDGFNSGSDYALFCVRFGTGVNFEYRYSFNNNADIIQYVAPPAPGVKSGVAIGYGLTGGTTYTLRP